MDILTNYNFIHTPISNVSNQLSFSPTPKQLPQRQNIRPPIYNNNFHPFQTLLVNDKFLALPLYHHPHYPLHQNENYVQHGMPPLISRNQTFQHLINIYTTFDKMYTNQNPHLVEKFPQAVHVSPQSTLEGLLNLPQPDNPLTHVLILIEERLTSSLIRLSPSNQN